MLALEYHVNHFGYRLPTFSQLGNEDLSKKDKKGQRVGRCKVVQAVWEVYYLRAMDDSAGGQQIRLADCGWV